MDYMHEDDELVYPLPHVRKAIMPLPNLSFLHAVPGVKSLKFEMLLRGAFCVCLADTGATHSFVSVRFCRANGLRYSRVASQALLADGKTELPIVGVLWNAQLKVECFNCKQSFLVLDFLDVNVVLGMDWMREHNALLSCTKRTMKLQTGKGPITVHAMSHEPAPTCSLHYIELRTIDAFARSLRDDSSVDCDSVVVAVLEHQTDAAKPLAGLGADLPDVQPLLDDFSNVLVPEIPGGLPPERFAADGRPTECSTEIAPGAVPYARPPKAIFCRRN
jgi:hypothetical protein